MSEKDAAGQSSVEAAYNNAHAEKVGKQMAASMGDSPAALGLPDNADSRVRMAAGLKAMSQDAATNNTYAKMGMSATQIKYLLDPATDALCAKAGPMLEEEIRQVGRDINTTHDQPGSKALIQKAEGLNETAKLYDATCKSQQADTSPVLSSPKMGGR